MESNIDGKELARLAQLSADHEMPEIIGALVAEVRRLNDIILNDIDIDVQNKVSIVHLTHENAALREKVEAWEWLEECRQCMEWLYAVCWETTPVREAEHSFLAAARAVHADRE